jgi:hypothetical protein
MKHVLPVSAPLLALALASAPAARADEASEIESLRSEVAALRATVADLAHQVQELQGKPAPPPPPEAEAPSPTTVSPPGPAASGQSSTYFNPSISLIGNFLGVGGSNPVEDLPAASLRESELSLQAVVDPYARADVFLSFPEEGVEVEEGNITFTSLPAGLLAKVGRMRVGFGKVNTMHLHVLPWADEPLPVVNLLGGEEGWVGTGVSVARMFPLGETFSELTVQVLDGDAEGLFAAPSRGDLAYDGHYRIFRDLGESTNLDFGLSYGQGPNGIGASTDTRLEAVDATFRWKPLQTATYRSATFRGEWMRSRREDLGTELTADGWYLSGDWQLAKRWFLGARIESADHADAPELTDEGAALLLTFWPSEFSQIRTELRRRRYFDTETADEILVQVQFAIGAHGAHPF